MAKIEGAWTTTRGTDCLVSRNVLKELLSAKEECIRLQKFQSHWQKQMLEGVAFQTGGSADKKELEQARARIKELEDSLADAGVLIDSLRKELETARNGREMRLCEQATEIGYANGISFLIRVHDNCGMPTGDTFIGNLRNEFVREVLESLVIRGYVDMSGLKLQKMRLMAIPADYKCDNGESGAYLLQGYEAACFTAFPGYPPLMGMGGAVPAMSKAEDV